MARRDSPASGRSIGRATRRSWPTSAADGACASPWARTTGSRVSGNIAPTARRRASSSSAMLSTATRYWAAIARQHPPPPGVADRRPLMSTQVGRYNIRTFKFDPVVDLPGVTFDSGALWIDETAGEALVAVNQDILSFPIARR